MEAIDIEKYGAAICKGIRAITLKKGI